MFHLSRLILFEDESLAQREPVGGITHQRRERAGLCCPAMLRLAVEAQGIAADGDADVLALAGLEEHFWKPFSSFSGRSTLH